MTENPNHTDDPRARISLDVRLCLTVEEATAALAALGPSPYSTAKGIAAGYDATAEDVRRELTTLVLEHGMERIRREADDLPSWEFVSGADTQLVSGCRDLVARLIEAEEASHREGNQ